jgi:hypothetical protein
MQTTGRPGLATLAALSLVVAVLVAACAGGSPTSAPASPTIPAPTTASTLSPEATGPLLTVETRGGECVGGPCGTTIVVERDGRVHQAAKPPNELGTLWPETLASLEAAIGTADFADIRSHPFTGECPTAYDGQEVVFEFGAPGGIERVATCEVAVDFGLPLFTAVVAAVGPYVSLPAR